MTGGVCGRLGRRERAVAMEVVRRRDSPGERRIAGRVDAARHGDEVRDERHLRGRAFPEISEFLLNLWLVIVVRNLVGRDIFIDFAVAETPARTSSSP